VSRVVLGYSGGLDASIAIPWLAETHGVDVVATTLDLGGASGLEAVRDRALAAGAVRAHVLDVREEFARDYLFRALRVGALCDRGDATAAALARSVIAQKLVHIAALEAATAVAHAARGAAAKALAVAVHTLNPDLRVLTPMDDVTMTLAERAEYARARHIVDAPGVELPDSGRPPQPGDAHAGPVVEIAFDRGVPAAINGVTMPFVELIATLDTIAAARGRGAAALILDAAHREMEAAVVPDHERRFARAVSGQYREIVRNGLWFTPLREALDAFVDRLQVRLTGIVHVQVLTGECRLIASPGGPAPTRRWPAGEARPPGGCS